MSKAMDERIIEERIRIAYNLLLLGTVSKEDIAKAIGLSINTINDLNVEPKPVGLYTPMDSETKELFRKTVEEMRESARKNGIQDMTLEEINAEIAEARK